MSGKHRVNLNNAKELTIDDYIHDIHLVWNKLDQERSIYDTWLHTVHHVSKLGEQVRRGRFDKLLDELADTIMWFLTFVGKLQQSSETRIIRIEEERLFYTPMSLTDIIWSKYPNICPVCFFRHYNSAKEDELWGKKCDCLLYAREVETRNELLSASDEDKLKGEKLEKVESLNNYATQNKHRQLAKLGDLQNMFEQIYQANIDSSPLDFIAFHLLEEVGEVSNALIRLYTYTGSSTSPPSKIYPQRVANLESELADVISWIFAVCLKVKYQCQAYDELAGTAPKSPVVPPLPSLSLGVNFWEILWRRYGLLDGKSLWCPICRNTICACPVVFATEQQKQQDMGLLHKRKHCNWEDNSL